MASHKFEECSHYQLTVGRLGYSGGESFESKDECAPKQNVS
jgi:hypothetical protein